METPPRETGKTLVSRDEEEGGEENREENKA
jgi:hypothetical protein